MMKMELKKKCEKCGSEENLTKIDEIFHFPCKCHSKTHQIRHYLCDKCEPDFKVSSNKRCDVIISPKIFCLILKAHGNYYQQFGNVRLDENTMKPKYVLNKTSNKVDIHIHCTYKVLTYIDDIYVQWMTDHPENPSKDKKKGNTNSKYYPDGNDLSTSTTED